MSELQLSLSEYLSTVQEVIKVAFDEPVGIKARIRNLSIKGGHYYLELAEKEEGTDKVIASCKAMIWKFSAAKMILKFERESGIELSQDLNVLTKIKAILALNRVSQSILMPLIQVIHLVISHGAISKY